MLRDGCAHLQIWPLEQLFILVRKQLTVKVYGRANVVFAYSLITDSVSNTYLIDHCGIEPYQHPKANDAAVAPSSSSSTATSASAIGLVISSSASFYAPTSFPNLLRVGLRVIQLGSSSVTYEVGIFEIPATDPGRTSSSLSSAATSERNLPSDAVAAVITRVTHVFVDRHSRRPLKPMPAQLHDGLAKLKVAEFMLDKAAGTSKL